MSKISDLNCGYYERRTWELFGVNGGFWVRIAEYDHKSECRNRYFALKAMNSYPDGLAYCDRIVKESRHILEASIPTLRVVSRMKGEDGEEGELVSVEVFELEEARRLVDEADKEPTIAASWIVDLTTMRTMNKTVDVAT